MSAAISRRELIALMLGLPALSSGCSSEPSLPPAGELLGQSHAIGHRIRDGFQPVPAEDAWQSVDVVIVGAGAAGLSAAWSLQKAGVTNFVVLELEPDAGGTSRAGQSEGGSFPWGAHYLPVPFSENRPLISLLQEMGLVESLDADGTPVIQEESLCREPEERLFFQDRWIEGLYPATGASKDDLAQLAAFRSEIDRWSERKDSSGRRAFVIPTSQSSIDPEVMQLDQQTMGDWLRSHGWNSERLHWLVDYSCRDDYGLTSEQTSAWAGILYFASRQEQAGSDHQPLMTWPEGNARLTRHLALSTGDRLKTGVAVTKISPHGLIRTEADIPVGKGAELCEVTAFETATQTAIGFRARRVIFAAPQFLAPRLIAGLSEQTDRSSSGFRYGSWVVANLHLKDRPGSVGFPMSWDNVIHGSPSLGYVVSNHQTGHDYGPTVLTWYYPVIGTDVRQVREKLLRATWAELADVVLTDLERSHPEIRQLTTKLDVYLWGHAMIQPVVGFRSSNQRANALMPFGGIHFANTDLSGIALFEEAFDHGCRAAAEVSAGLSG
jgi:phytoene dehydrogenase-like protein